MHYNFDRQMSLIKSKCWYSNNCLLFLKRAVPFDHYNLFSRPLVPTKYTSGYARFSNLGLSSYTFYVTSDNEVGTAANASKVFVPHQGHCKFSSAWLVIFGSRVRIPPLVICISSAMYKTRLSAHGQTREY
jgi:hypothetical protein